MYIYVYRIVNTKVLILILDATNLNLGFKLPNSQLQIEIDTLDILDLAIQIKEFKC